MEVERRSHTSWHPKAPSTPPPPTHTHIGRCLDAVQECILSLVGHIVPQRLPCVPHDQPILMRWTRNHVQPNSASPGKTERSDDHATHHAQFLTLDSYRSLQVCTEQTSQF